MSRPMATSASRATARSTRATVPKATPLETLAVAADVVIPTIAKGVIIRRPRMVALAERLELDTRAVRRLQRPRDKYGTGPLLLRVPIRRQALILAPEHVHRVLEQTPEPFATATMEKRAALPHFEPRNALISQGPERAERRQYNEAVLDTDRVMHRLAERCMAVVGEEGEWLLATTRRRGALVWDDFIDVWYRAVRRVMLGEGAADDRALTDVLVRLRQAANWALLRPRQPDLRERFYALLNAHLERAEPGSLAAVMAATPTTETTAPAEQLAQGLLAFDPAAMATFRALALLAAHPAQAERAQAEIQGRNRAAPPELPFLRACVLESLRLWPTTPVVLRESTRETMWESGELPANTSIPIYAPFFHRNDQRLAYAHCFQPELWLESRTTADWPLIPFSGSPAMCPARNLVLLMTSAMLATLLDGRQVRLKPPSRLDGSRPMPGTLDNYTLRFELQAHERRAGG